MNTIEKNIMLADFLSYEKNHVGDYFIPDSGYENPVNFKFHTDWNWLIQVVEKIESIGYRVDILKNICTIDLSYKNTIISYGNIPKIEKVYKACVEFIIWYNQQN